MIGRRNVLPRLPKLAPRPSLATAICSLVVYWPCTVVALSCLWPAHGWAQQPLHERVDSLLEAGLVVPPACPTSDHEFLRRVCLDLTGRIPSADDLRQFTADSAPDKRTRIVDQLLASPEFIRHMTVSLDVMFMERRQDKHVPTAEWRQYLYDSIAAHKPLNELYREILSADGVDPARRPIAKFFLDREAEPNLLTRDVGRIVFGMDIQCAQCHDHPLIADYEQNEYYGLFAFYQRSSLFLDTKDNNKAYLAETAEGDASFKSVFTEEEGKTLPRVPGGNHLEDVLFAKDDAYLIKPDKEVRAVPKYSRRTRLAEEVGRGDNRAFQRNVANRLWAHMMGRGLVDPVDLHHDDNPSAHPELLDLLADELASMRFDLRAFLRELALTRAYQRSVNLPEDWRAVAASVAPQVPTLEVDAAVREAERTAALELASERDNAANAKREELASLRAALAEKQVAFVEAEKAARDAELARANTQQQIESKRSLILSLNDALVASKRAAELLPGETSLADAIAKLQAQADKTNGELKVSEESLPAQQQTASSAAQALVAAQQAYQSEQANWEQVSAPLRELESQSATAADQLRHAENRWLIARIRLADAQKLAAALPLLQGAATSLEGNTNPESGDTAGAAQEVISSLAETCIHHGATAPLKPLTPEQLAWSMLKATGVLQRQQAASEAEIKQKPDAANDPQQLAIAIEKDVYAKLEGNVTEFVRLFGGGAGQPQNVFFATVDQALFFANGGALASWLAPSGGNLTERLLKLDDPAALADELYMSILTRAPTSEEALLVRQSLESQPQDKAAVVQQLAWALITSAEFRFSQ